MSVEHLLSEKIEKSRGSNRVHIQENIKGKK